MDLLVAKGLTIVGGGRLGTALATSLTRAGINVLGPVHRGEPVTGRLVLFAVPDREVAKSVGRAPNDAVVGHTAGALSLEPMGDREAFSFHPLMTVIGDQTSFAGAAAAIAGSTSRALDVARSIAARLSMEPIEIPEDRRAEYHAAASIASNFLVTLESMAQRVGSVAGLERRHLLPLARAALENWGALGTPALTGPIARGDSSTVDRQRAAVAAVAPELLPAWDALAAATTSLTRGAK